jgi:hypothetical protein
VNVFDKGNDPCTVASPIESVLFFVFDTVRSPTQDEEPSVQNFKTPLSSPLHQICKSLISFSLRLSPFHPFARLITSKEYPSPAQRPQHFHELSSRILSRQGSCQETKGFQCNGIVSYALPTID